jgi:RNA polymerase sigma factor for flagellar operon FliA
MLDGIRALDGASRSQRRRDRELSDIAESLSQLQRRTVTVDEAADAIGCIAPIASVPAPRLVSWEVLPDQVPGVPGSEERTELELLITGGTLLNDMERTTLYLSYFGDFSLAEIGAHFGVTESRACQVRKAALAKLRTALERDERANVPAETVQAP